MKMMRVNKFLIILMALILFLNSGVVFAADKDSESYKKGYDVGLAESENYAGTDGDEIRAYNRYLSIKDKEYEDIMDSIDGFSPSDFRQGFIDGFLQGQREQEVIDYPKELGKAYGNIYGARDFQNGRRSDWERAMPSDREIRSMFNLRTQDSDYIEFFIDGFKVAFKDEYINSYDRAKFEPYRVSYDQGVKDGEEMGELMGSAYGYKDYYEGEERDHERHLPNDRIITTEYSLSNDSEEYKEGFLSGFIRKFVEAYNAAYRDANMNDSRRDEGDALTNGQEMGAKRGEMQAVTDYMQRLTNDWRRSIPKEDAIITEYNLTLQSPNYRDNFISGFYDGYSAGYTTKFKELAQGAGMDKVTSAVVPKAGGNLSSLDNAFMVTVEPGTYYHDVNLSISTSYDAAFQQPSRLTKASDSYNVRILNTSNNIDDKKPVTVSFEYYGDKVKGGIYKLVNGNWTYIPTVIDDGYMHAEVKPSSLKADGNVFSAFMDTGYILFPDARGHWARDEIFTYVRRNVIYGYTDMTFRPEQNITRAEFLTLLSRIYNWNTTYHNINTHGFKDYGLFGNRAGIIGYAFGNGYIRGYDDGNFKPNDPISYREIEIIMGRVLGGMSFKWNDIATDMMYKHKVRSSSFDDMNNKITRAEVVYMLYKTTEN